MAINDGGPAFPCLPVTTGNGDSVVEASGGMTLRDYFAAKVMAAAIQTSAMPAWNLPATDYDHLANGAYKAADAMLRRRSLP